MGHANLLWATGSLKEAISIRYGKDLYHNYGRSSSYHFIYAYKRFFIEIAKTLFGLLKSRPAIAAIESIGLYSTHNQQKALRNATRAGHCNALLLPLDKLSRKALVLRLLVWSTKPLIYPFCFIFSKNRPALYQTCLLSGMVRYTREYANRLDQLGVRNLWISNDHAGDIYLLSILVRENLNLTVNYVQHGAVKPTFPENHFNNIYVYSEKYAEVYRSLARKPDVQIIIDQSLSGVTENHLPNIDLLVCFSHHFPLVASTALMLELRKLTGIKVAVRFHPSDRLFRIKWFMLRLFHPINISDSSVTYTSDFSRAKLVLCASSSLLPDAVERGLGNRLIWARQLGLGWDYYGLHGKIKEVSSAREVTKLLNRGSAQ